jgi:hypothetical protein
MPEAAVHKDHEPESREHEIGRAGKIGAVQAISESGAVDRFPNLKFGDSILAVDPSRHFAAGQTGLN